MKKRIKATLFALTTLAAITFVSGCSSEDTPYEINNKDNYTVSVKYDANGGSFTTNTSVIVDSYNIADMKKNGAGEAEIALLSPDNSSRGNDAFTAIKNGYFLAGWYATRTENGVDAQGNPVYTYADRWDFSEDKLKVGTNKSYSADEPVITLYAAWVPMFEIQFYSLDSGEYLDTINYDPTTATEIKLPQWNEKTGTIEMYSFPEKSGYTFDSVYYDEKGVDKLTSQAVDRIGVLDYETGTAKNNIMKLYVKWIEGEWYHIYNAKQFIDNASVNGCYEIHADIDFEEEIWPSSLMYGNFNGTINGNGHVFKNINFTQTNNSKVNVGLFGNLTDKSKIADLTFENVSLTIKAGTRMVGTSFGLLAGTISNNAIIEELKVLNSSILIDSGCYFGVDDYSIGLLCGMGDAGVVSDAQITCTATGDNPERVNIVVNGNTVNVDIATE